MRKPNNIIGKTCIFMLIIATIITIIATITNHMDYTKYKPSEKDNVITITRNIRLSGDPIYDVEYIKANTKIVKTITIPTDKIVIDNTITTPQIVIYTRKIGPFNDNHEYLYINQADYIYLKHNYQKIYEGDTK